MDADGAAQTYSARHRPFELPERLADLRGPLRGVVVLPLHVRWSDPPRRYDMSRRSDPVAVYEQAPEEGTAADIQALVDLAGLVELWDELYLPVHLRRPGGNGWKQSSAPARGLEPTAAANRRGGGRPARRRRSSPWPGPAG